MAMIRKIPSSVLNEIKNKYNLTHLVLWAKSDEGQYVLANGNTVDNCIQSTLIANKFKATLGWPDATMPSPPKLTNLLAENHKLKIENEKLKNERPPCDHITVTLPISKCYH